ncbi:MAG: hypothetical protein ACI9MR_004130 [Myxococcota bacterium]
MIAPRLQPRTECDLFLRVVFSQQLQRVSPHLILCPPILRSQAGVTDARRACALLLGLTPKPRPTRGSATLIPTVVQARGRRVGLESIRIPVSILARRVCSDADSWALHADSSDKGAIVTNHALILAILCALPGCDEVKRIIESYEPPPPCDAACSILPDDGPDACTTCVERNLEGTWDLVIEIPGDDGFEGEIEVCCGGVDVKGRLGAGVNSCSLVGDACGFQVVCDFASISGCSGQLALDGAAKGENELTGAAAGCNRQGSFRATRTTPAPCRTPPSPTPTDVIDDTLDTSNDADAS